MSDFTKPPEIARETLRRLALERLAPTPDNYRLFYQRISGIEQDDCFPTQAFRRITGALPRNTQAQLRFARQFETAVGQQKWPPLGRAILDLCEATESQALTWAPLILQMLEQLERHHADHSRTRKKEAVRHVLQSSAADTATLHRRLSGLVGSWASAVAAPATAGVEIKEADGDTGEAPVAETEGIPLVARELGGSLDNLLRRGVATLLFDNPTLADATRTVGGRLAEGPSRPQMPALSAELEELTLKLEWAGEDQEGIRDALVALLQLVMENISQLVIDDKWLSGQLAVLREAFSQPLDIRMLDEVERRLRDVIDQQGLLKQELSDAQLRLKQMLAGFIDRLADMSESTGSFHDTLERCADRIEAAVDIGELSDVIEEMLRETRIAQEDARRSREDLSALQDQVEMANAQIAQLQHELHHTSALVRHDALTGTLNRKGLDEALEREIARARRRGSTLCIGLLDVDNFKRINDTHGHNTGDAALQHLAAVIKDNLRPQDSLGRYGGEEFLILLPDTEVHDAVGTLTRLQRALTTRFFLADGQKMLITFSAGVARLGEDEPAEAAVDRADKAMYRAKRAGKNRVMMA